VSSLFPALCDPEATRRPAMRFGERALTYAEPAAATGKRALGDG